MYNIYMTQTHTHTHIYIYIHTHTETHMHKMYSQHLCSGRTNMEMLNAYIEISTEETNSLP